MGTEILVINGHTLSTNLFSRIVSIANKVGNHIGPDIAASTGEIVKSPLSERIIKSKFHALLEDMNDDQVKATAVALLFDTKVQEAVKAYHKSNTHYTQVAAIAYQLSKRGIEING